MSLLKRIGLTFVTLILFYFSMKLLFKNNAELAMIVTASVALHEIGHAAAVMMYGIRGMNLFFVPFLGAAVSMPVGISESISKFKYAVIVLAGPLVNILLVILGWGMLSFSTDWHRAAMSIIAVNASLAALNLIPVGFLDGGKFVGTLFYSADNQGDARISGLITFVGLGVGLILALLGGKFLLIFWAIFFGIRREAAVDHRNGHLSEKALTPIQIRALATIYVIMLTSMWVIDSFMPTWNKLY